MSPYRQRNNRCRAQACKSGCRSDDLLLLGSREWEHRENYDDRWRCEVQFDPVLDEAFGITHTKQQIRPQGHLIEALTPDLEATARALNGRARKAHLAVKSGERFSEAERVASERDHLLRPLPNKPSRTSKALMSDLEKNHPVLRRKSGDDALRYIILEKHRVDLDLLLHEGG